MIRAFKQASIPAGGGPFPCYGSALTASVVPQPTRQTDIYISGQLPVTVSVADNSMFRLRNRALIVAANGTLSVNADVIALSGSTSITLAFPCAGTPNPSFNAGDFVVLCETCASMTVQGTAGSAGDYYFGTGPTFTQTNDCFWIARKQPAGIQDPYMQTNLVFGANPMNTAEIWVLGTAGDTFRASMLVN